MFIGKAGVWTSYYNYENKEKESLYKTLKIHLQLFMLFLPCMIPLSFMVILHDAPLLESLSPSLAMKFPHLVLPNVDRLSLIFVVDGYFGFVMKKQSSFKSLNLDSFMPLKSLSQWKHVCLPPYNPPSMPTKESLFLMSNPLLRGSVAAPSSGF